LDRALATGTLITTTTTNDTAQIVATFNVTGSKSLVESGLFTAASVGTMLCRKVFGAVAVINGNVLRVTWTIQFS
jgi:hypothetical protein